MKERLFYMDILRLLAVLLVMFAHFVFVGTFAKQIPLIIDDSNNNALPLFKSDGWNLWVFDSKLIDIFHTQAGIIGVLLFFLITGYLITDMQNRYNRRGFIVNRIFRIFPALIFCVCLIGYFVDFTQGIKFSPSSYFGSVTLTYSLIGVLPIMGVLWTLVVEVLFYVVAFLIGRFNQFNLTLLQAILLFIIFYSTKLSDNNYINFMGNNSKYILFILVGVALKIAESKKDYAHKFTVVVSSIIFSYLGFKIYQFGHDDPSTYNNLGSQLLSFSIFLLLYGTQKWTLRFFRKVPVLFYKIVDLTYPLYLLHASIGLGSIFFIRNYFVNQYVILLIASMICVCFAIIIHILVEKPMINLGRSFIKKYLQTKPFF